MGIFSFITNPLRVAGHIAGSGMGRGAAGVTGFVSANASMNSTRFQLRSYEARELFDSKRLAAHFKLYHKVRHQLMRYKRKDKRGLCPKIEHLYHKHKDHPDVLKKVLAHEVGIFADYYIQLLRVVSAIEMEEGDMVLQQNASTISDVEALKGLIGRIPDIAKKQNIALVEQDFDLLLSQVQMTAHKDIKIERTEMKERLRAEKGKKIVRGIGAFFAGITGVGHIAHKLRKHTKRLVTHDIRKFDQDFAELRQSIERGQISDVTMSHLRFLIKNYEKIRKHYFEINQDIMLLMGKLFEDFQELQEECVVPFYASVKSIPGSDTILKISEKLRELYQKFDKEYKKEEWEIRLVHKHLEEFVNACQQAVEQVHKSNEAAIHNLEEKMTITAPVRA